MYNYQFVIRNAAHSSSQSLIRDSGSDFEVGVLVIMEIIQGKKRQIEQDYERGA